MSFFACPRGAWRIDGNRLLVEEDDGWHAYTILPTPIDVVRTFDGVFAASGLRCRPRLVWLAHAGGHGGFATGGLVAIGARDIEDIVSAIAAGYFHTIAQEIVELHRLLGMPVPGVTRAQIRTALLRFVVAHELGHSWQQERGVRASKLELEGRADHFTGWMHEKLRWDTRLARIVAHALGCAEDFCDHPDPDGRVDWFEGGRAYRRRQVARAAIPWIA